MSKPAVLCITAEAIKNITSMGNIQEEDLHFINRKIVDNKEDITIGEKFPQIIPSIALQTKSGKYLTYARNGNETRLHGSRSLTVGGHIDITDYQYSMRETIIEAARREIYEETGLRVYVDYKDFTDFIYLPTDNVSKVHFGLYTLITIKDETVINPDDELHDIQFLSKDQLLKDIHLYEAWSQHIINQLI